MISEKLRNSMVAKLTLIGGGVGLALILAHVSAIAQQGSDTKQGANPARPAGAPAADSRRDTAKEPRERARRRAMTLGAEMQPQADHALLATKIEENGLAARAGLRQDDRIISVDGRAFASGRQLDAYLAGQGGRRVPIVIVRGGQRSTIYVTPAQVGGDTAWLGVFLEEDDGGAKGTRITHVYPSGPAARAGLHAGDIITQIDDRKIDSPSDVIMFVQESEPESETQFTILRNDQDLKIPVLLGRREHFTRQLDANGYGGANYPQEQQHGDRDDFENVPPHAMQLEHDRRIAEQHERIEQELRALREEIRQLREELKKR